MEFGWKSTIACIVLSALVAWLCFTPIVNWIKSDISKHETAHEKFHRDRPDIPPHPR